MSSAEWYYAERGTSNGPISEAELDALVEGGKLMDTTLVWTDGMSDWVSYGQVKGAPEFVATPQVLVPEPQFFGFKAAVIDGFRRFFDFETRSNRSQFWFFQLALVIGGFFAGIVDGAFGTSVQDYPPGTMLFTAIIFLPAIALSIRRLHDIGRSGWWLFLTFVPVVGWLVLLVFHILPSQKQTNNWGAPI